MNKEVEICGAEFVSYGKARSKEGDGVWLTRNGEPIALCKNEFVADEIIAMQKRNLEIKCIAVKSLTEILSKQ